jgi:oligosaccharide repeat unit polymerase
LIIINYWNLNSYELGDVQNPLFEVNSTNDLMKNFILNNGLFLAFVVPQLVMLLFAQFDVDEIPNIEISEALFFHFSAVSLFVLGYFISSIILYGNKKKSTTFIRLSSKLKNLSFLLIIIGLITSISTMMMFVGVGEYFVMLLSGNFEILELRAAAAHGGISGVFKMFNYAPLAVYMLTSSLLFFCNTHPYDNKTLKKIQRVALVGSILKVFFSLDRLTILAILVVLFFYILKSSISKFKIVLYSVFGVLFLSFITSIRQGESIIYFLSLYSKLGITNLQMILDSNASPTYNGANTFLLPLNTVFSFLNIPALKEYAITSYQWNSAQYFNAYLFQDFGYLSLFFYPFFALICKIIEIKKNNGSLFFIGSYLFLFFVLITFITVPFIRAVECWFVLLVVFLITHYFIKKYI